MLIGALGCNLAWGIIDAIMYLMACLADRALSVRLVARVRSASTAQEAQSAIAASLPSVVASILAPADLVRIHAELSRMPEQMQATGLRREDWVGALAVFLLVVISTIPVVVPFFFLQDAYIALRISNAVAVAMMFVVGYAFGRVAGLPPLGHGRFDGCPWLCVGCLGHCLGRLNIPAACETGHGGPASLSSAKVSPPRNYCNIQSVTCSAVHARDTVLGSARSAARQGLSLRRGPLKSRTSSESGRDRCEKYRPSRLPSSTRTMKASSAAGRGMQQLAAAIEKEGFRVVAGVTYKDARRLVEDLQQRILLAGVGGRVGGLGDALADSRRGAGGQAPSQRAAADLPVR